MLLLQYRLRRTGVPALAAVFETTKVNANVRGITSGPTVFKMRRLWKIVVRRRALERRKLMSTLANAIFEGKASYS